MNEAIIENYLGNIQGIEPDYMTEGIRDFVAKFDKVMLKRTAEKLHNAFTKGDAKAYDEVARKTARVAKIPKYRELKDFTDKFQEENPQIAESFNLSKKVLRNTFKIRDKAKLEIISTGIGMTAWIKSKGGRYDTLKLTRDTLKDIHTQTMHIYDTGFDEYEPTTQEEEQMIKRLNKQAKRQEKMEIILVGVVLAVLVAALVWGGIVLWGILSNPVTVAIALTVAWIMMLWKVMLGILAVTLPIIMTIIGFKKAIA